MKITSSSPPELVAVTVYVLDAVTAVGVPVISPVLPSNTSPLGKDGDTDQEIITPPLVDGVIGEIEESLVNVNEVCE